MAGIYTIGSKLGYDIATGMKPGQSVTVENGAVWTKNADGSITVNHQGQQMVGQITYNPTTAQQSGVANMPGATGYSSPYAERLNQVISGLEGTKWEGWNADTDPAMQAYRKQYLREAERSAEDVLGQYAQNTGGIAGSQAIAAATQASDYYKSQLADKVPQLYENAYSRHLNEVAQKNNLANLLMNAESQANSQYYQRIDYALTKWGQMGYADQEVASILGVTAGTPTSDQSYTNWSTAFQNEQFDYEKRQAAAKKTGYSKGEDDEEEEEEEEKEPEKTGNEMSESEFKQFWTRFTAQGNAAMYITASEMLEAVADKMSDEQYEKALTQLKSWRM